MDVFCGSGTNGTMSQIVNLLAVTISIQKTLNYEALVASVGVFREIE
jgi:hypothetical protein